MSQLPNHLIMDIIKIADGGLNTHKSKYVGVLKFIKKEGGLIPTSNPSFPNFYWGHYILDVSYMTCRNGELIKCLRGTGHKGRTYYDWYEDNHPIFGV